MKDYDMPPSLCPECGYGTNAAGNMTGKGKPRPKDFSLCLSCGALLRLDQDLRLQLTSYEVARDDLRPEQLRLITTAQSYIRTRGPIDKVQNAN